MTGAMAADRRASTLADGAQLPLLGLGVWQVPDGRECVDAVRWALELGYRHIDTAQAYGNEESVGQGLRESGVPRDQVFITTKFNPGRGDPVAEVERSLERLGVERVDLNIVDWPGVDRPGRGEEGSELRSWVTTLIGASNSRPSNPTGARNGHHPTVVNQVQQSERDRKGLLDACRVHSIVSRLQPFGHGRDIASETVTRIAQCLGRTPAQVLFAAIERDAP